MKTVLFMHGTKQMGDRIFYGGIFDSVNDIDVAKRERII